MRSDARNIKPHFGFCPGASGSDHGEPRRFFFARIGAMNRGLGAPISRSARSGHTSPRRVGARRSNSWGASTPYVARIRTMNRDWLVAQAFQPARFGRLSSRPSLVHRTGNSGKPAGWKTCPPFRFMERRPGVGTTHCRHQPTLDGLRLGRSADSSQTAGQ